MLAFLCTIFFIAMAIIMIVGAISAIYKAIKENISNINTKSPEEIERENFEFRKSANNMKHRLTLKGFNVKDFVTNYSTICFCDENFYILERENYTQSGPFMYTDVERFEEVDYDGQLYINITLISETAKITLTQKNTQNTQEYEEAVKIATDIINELKRRISIVPIRQSWKMNMYEVKGINPKTNHKKSETVIVIGNNEKDILNKTSLINVSDYELIPPEPPTSNQIDYAASLGISLNGDFSKTDISSAISKALDEDDNKQVPLEFAEYAADKNIYLSSYVGLTGAYNIVFNSLKDIDKKMFFAFSYYQKINGFITFNPLKHPDLHKFETFATENANNISLENSIAYYSGADLIHDKPLKKIKAYEICEEYFKNK